jgi:hypothetical protein
MAANLTPSAQNPILVPLLYQGRSNGLTELGQSPAQVLANFPRVAATSTLTFSTNPTNGDTLTLTVHNLVFPGNSFTASFIASSDTTTTAAAKLAAALNLSANGMAFQVVGTSLANVLTVHEFGPVGNLTQVSFHSTGSTIAVLSNQASGTAVVGGSATESDVVTLVFTNANFSGGHENVSYTVPATPTLAEVAAGLNTAINNDVVLKANHISSTVSSETLTISQQGPNFATLSYTQGENSETIAFASLLGQLQGGSGAIIPAANFNFAEGPVGMRFLQAQPVSLSPNVVADLVAAGMPII